MIHPNKAPSMRNHGRRSRQFAFGAAISLLLLCSCSKLLNPETATYGLNKPLKTQVSDALPIQQIQTIALFPLQSGLTREVAPDELTRINQKFALAFKQYSTMEVMHLAEGDTFLENQKSATLQKAATDYANRVGAQAVVFGTVNRMRPGTQSYEGAAVSFRLWLFDLNSRETLWSASYDHENRALTENIFDISRFFKRGVHFPSMWQIMEAALRAAAENVEQYRTLGGSE